MNFFDSIWECLNESNFSSKVVKLNAIWANFDSYSFERTNKAKALIKPSYADFCKVYEISEFPRQKGDKTACFLHAVAHIEYSAIDIALDACYRFDGLPKEYYADWLEVASDEIRHFELINKELEKTKLKYGDLPVHNGLFVALQKTAHNFLHRMAILPRHLEASGLDANTNILGKMSAENELVPLLELIRDEEISHVQKGDKWFKYACERDKIDPNSWLEIVLSYYPKAFFNTKPIDKERRLQAGFSEHEIEKIEQIMKNSTKEN